MLARTGKQICSHMCSENSMFCAVQSNSNILQQQHLGCRKRAAGTADAPAALGEDGRYIQPASPTGIEILPPNWQVRHGIVSLLSRVESILDLPHTSFGFIQLPLLRWDRCSAGVSSAADLFLLPFEV